MRMTVRILGKSASVRIPATMMKAAKIGLDQVVDVSEERGRIIIEPVSAAETALDEMAAAITPKNRHRETEWGAPLGSESL